MQSTHALLHAYLAASCCGGGVVLLRVGIGCVSLSGFLWVLLLNVCGARELSKTACMHVNAVRCCCSSCFPRVLRCIAMCAKAKLPFLHQSAWCCCSCCCCCCCCRYRCYCCWCCCCCCCCCCCLLT